MKLLNPRLFILLAGVGTLGVLAGCEAMSSGPDYLVFASGNEAGFPIRGGVGVMPSAHIVNFTLWLKDSAGRNILGVIRKGERRPLPPKVEVTDAAGKVVYTGTLEYG